MFSAAESRRINDAAVPVRILGGADMDDAGRAFMERYGVGGYPTLMAMTAGGAVLASDLTEGRLGAWIEDPAAAVAAVVQGMTAAEAREDAFQAESKVLAEKKISPGDMDLMIVTDDPAEAARVVEQAYQLQLKTAKRAAQPRGKEKGER